MSDYVEYPILPDHFEPSELSGLFITTDHAYPYGEALKAAQEGYAEIYGELMLPDLTLAKVFKFYGDGRKSNPSEYDRVVKVPPESFLAPLQDYNNWPVMFWREIIQNSVDAGCTRMILSTKSNNDGSVTISAEDNASGMTLDILENALLTVKGTTKRAGGGTAGGFGEAKRLVLFPWKSYKIHSQDNLITGQHHSYRHETTSYLQGTKISVVMSQDTRTTLKHAIMYLSKCYIPNVTFVLMDLDAEPTDKMHKLTLTARQFGPNNMEVLEQGENHQICYKKQKKSAESCEKSGAINVRIKSGDNYLHMFDWSVDSYPGHLTVEIIAASTEVLTSARNRFTYYKGGIIEKAITAFATRIAKDVVSGLKSKQGYIRKIYRGTGSLGVYDTPIIPTHIKDFMEKSRDGFEISDNAVEDIKDQMKSKLQSDGGSANDPNRVDPEDRIKLFENLLRGMPLAGAEHLENALSQATYTPDFVLISEIPGFTPPPRFTRENMTPRVRRMLRVYTEIIRWCLMQMNVRLDCKFAVGFHFSTQTLGSYLNYEGEHFIMINPLAGPDESRKRMFTGYRQVSYPGMQTLSKIEEGTPQNDVERELLKHTLSPTDPDHFAQMYAVAVHEITHMVDRLYDHDEYFSSALTRNMGLCAKGIGKRTEILKYVTERE